MIKRICDRCNKEIKGNYWTISIREKEDSRGMLTADGATNNLKRVFSNEEEYCKDCIAEIEDCIANIGKEEK